MPFRFNLNYNFNLKNETLTANFWGQRSDLKLKLENVNYLYSLDKLVKD